MPKNTFDKAVDRLVSVELAAVDKFIKEFIMPLKVHDNPEKVLGKPFEQWTQQDLNILKGIYGEQEPNVLSNFIFRKKYDQVKELESEEF